MFTAPLRSNDRGADHRKYRSSIASRVRFRENVFTEPLASNDLFRLSGVMSQYDGKNLQAFLLFSLSFFRLMLQLGRRHKIFEELHCIKHKLDAKRFHRLLS
jgi:hypothetical protein